MPSSDLPRTVLPIPERPHAGLVTYDASSLRSSRFEGSGHVVARRLEPHLTEGSGGQGDHVGVGRSAESTCRARASV